MSTIHFSVRCFFLFGLVLLPACRAVSPTAAPSPTVPPAVTLALAPSITPLPTATPIPSATTTAIPTALPGETATPKPDDALSQVSLLGLSWIEDYNMLLSFEFPGPVDAERYRVMLEEKTYDCQVLPDFPNRLYCHGPGAKVLAEALVRVFSAGSNVPGFEKRVWIPYFDNDYNTVPRQTK